ncbi:MAG: imidazole glycerol phosphate synthase subunit HisH [Desulfovibrio sp.]|nr:imidazole glycerol phosphate synthase subunit HisH [Desulfovibrio sp.]
MLGIVDYKAGNQTSVRRALDHLGIPCVITYKADDLRSCSGIIFPGVGAAGQAMKILHARGLDQVMHNCVEQKIPILGICLGCQILLEYSEENDTPLLRIMKGSCKRFADTLHQEDGSPAPVPHMGWNTISIKSSAPPSPLLQDIPSNASFYFVHSYYVEPAPEFVIATTRYGHEFCSVYGKNGLWGVQFHPEKSGRPGLQLLKNFARFCQDRQGKGISDAE